MPDRIYKVVDGVIKSAKIIKETPKLYWIEPDHFFSYSSTFRKEHACITPEEAVQEELNMALNNHAVFEKRYNKMVDRLARAKELAAIYLNNK